MDELDLIRRFGDDVPGPDVDSIRRARTALFQRIEGPSRRVAGSAGEVRGRRRRVAGLVLLPAALVALAGAAYAIITPGPMDVVDGIACADRADRNSDLTVVRADGRDPVEICTELWEDGVVATGVREAPPLVACTTEEGVWVFPGGEGTCQELGMAPLPGGYARAAERFAAMRDELVRRSYATECFPPNAARTAAREVLDEYRFTGWEIEESGFGPCVTVGFDPPRRVVMLIRADG